MFRVVCKGDFNLILFSFSNVLIIKYLIKFSDKPPLPFFNYAYIIYLFQNKGVIDISRKYLMTNSKLRGNLRVESRNSLEESKSKIIIHC